MSGENSPRSLISRLFSRENFNPNWKQREGESVCPPKKGRSPSGEDAYSSDGNRSVDVEKDSSGSCGNRSPSYVPPSKMCPPREQCCYIKMQDPKAPCCRDHRTELPPCPPKHRHTEPRDPICECDRCRKRGGRCCENGYRRTNVDPRYFQQA